MFEEKKYVCWSCHHDIDMTTEYNVETMSRVRQIPRVRIADSGIPDINECRENTAHYIRDREKANFCMAFEFKSTTEADAAEANDARDKLEALFKNLK